ncbi:hypothetical protein EMPS_06989 [Entomortierella parvispora]|uniref:Uncharacterized protein n=1 Tax=Entomortierella parvispora TaxID=205924 RepID=A0A9P3HD83_9FUNG|nr:hypothetical protein EMPS_06989 [Entomortierella parvispora]
MPLTSCTRYTSPTDRVLILTPMMEAAPFLDGYFQRLFEVDHPKDHISLGFLVSTRTNPSSNDPTLAQLKTTLQRLSILGLYRKITLIHQTSKSDNYSHSTRHLYNVQSSRRRVLAECRNTLLSWTLSDESWVLWLDVDVIEYSPQLISRLMAFHKDIIVPNCFRMEGSWWKKKLPYPYDRNNWHETLESLAHQRALDEEDILFEGYENQQPTFRQSLADIQDPSLELVELDGVGGTFTLVNATVHHHGINFPLDPIGHQIETEGFAKWAKIHNFSAFGAPHLMVYHA